MGLNDINEEGGKHFQQSITLIVISGSNTDMCVFWSSAAPQGGGGRGGGNCTPVISPFWACQLRSYSCTMMVYIISYYAPLPYWATYSGLAAQAAQHRGISPPLIKHPQAGAAPVSDNGKTHCHSSSEYNYLNCKRKSFNSKEET